MDTITLDGLRSVLRDAFELHNCHCWPFPCPGLPCCPDWWNDNMVFTSEIAEPLLRVLGKRS